MILIMAILIGTRMNYPMDLGGTRSKKAMFCPMGDLQDPKMEVPTIYKAYVRPM